MTKSESLLLSVHCGQTKVNFDTVAMNDTCRLYAVCQYKCNIFVCILIHCTSNETNDTYPGSRPQLLDDTFYPVHNVSSHGLLLWSRWDEVEEIHDFLMKAIRGEKQTAHLSP